MDEKSQHTLELPKVLARLSEYTDFSASSELALSLRPAEELGEALRRQTETTEARHLMSLGTLLTVGGARDVRERVRAASIGAVLEPSDLLEVASTLEAAKALSKTLGGASGEHPVLWEVASGLEALPEVVAAVSQSLDDRGQVVDDASTKLATIRRDLRVTRDRLTRKLQGLLGDPGVASMLQEPIVTQRDGRYVLPLRSEYKGRLKSVIHDQSSSGATLFVEPLQIVEMNNELRQLELNESQEVQRILAELSALVGRNETEIVQTVGVLAALDLVFAKARYAEAIDAVEPILEPLVPSEQKLHPGTKLKLLSARHPLLDPDLVVPIDLVLDAETFALVLTGPNTGGKTVALKTAGLLCLMSLCGLHIPAASGSELSVFRDVLADIGDEQSIEQSLSTFSSHIANIIRILDRADPGSIVMLDELGAGTDPQEGSVLAQSILSTLVSRRVTTLVATHYAELKTYAHNTPGVRNASVEFDLETLSPTYHLMIGLPGRSNALAIAERLGLERGIIERARSMLRPGELQAESLLNDIYRQREDARQALKSAELEREQAKDIRTGLAERLDSIEEERRLVLGEAHEQADSDLGSLREEIRRLRRRLEASAKPLAAVEDAERDLERLEQSMSRQMASLQHEVVTETDRLQIGDRVRLKKMGVKGVVVELDKEHAEVLVGRLRIKAKIHELAPVEAASTKGGGDVPGRTPIGTSESTGIPAAKPPPLDLDLRGRAVDEALEELELRLDSAYMAGLPFVRIIHGKGTGRLRQAIRQALARFDYVVTFEPGRDGEGGEGVTVARLATD